MDNTSRQNYNKACLAYLSDYINKHPEMRFIQALWGCGLINRTETKISQEGMFVTAPIIEDRFYEEPNITLKKLELLFEEERKK